MLFTSATFILAFLPAVLAAYFIVPRRFRAVRNAVLLVFSLAFYGWGEPKLILLMLASVAINYGGALACDKITAKTARKAVFILAVAANLGLLGVFKYADFAAASVNSILAAFGGGGFNLPGIALPIGISFYTFQGLGYLIDVYRADVKAERNPAVVALYISLFPQLIAGPIVRYTDVAADIRERGETAAGAASGLFRFALGFSKKMILANGLAEAADSVFDAFGASTSLVLPASAAAIIGALAYAGQIYFDFSGYSDMAIGIGRVFGFRFRENFNAPYLAASAGEFWRRWHISLSGWFRDYVYIPLGGSRHGTLKTVRNLAVVWLLTGLWHGAAWNFVAWGAWWLMLLLGERYVWKNFITDTGVKSLAAWRVKRVLRHVCLMLAVLLGWILFRSESISAAVKYVGVLFGSNGFWDNQAVYLLRQYAFELTAGLCVILAPAVKSAAVNRAAGTDIKTTASAAKIEAATRTISCALSRTFIFAAFLWSIVLLVSGGYNPFIYFRF